MNEQELRELMCDIGRRIYNRNMVAANDGNFSVRLAENEYLCTPTGVSKGFMTPGMMLKVDGQGKVLAAKPPYRPTSEFKMHLRVYHDRPDVSAVVHAHPMYATAFAICGKGLTAPILPEAVISLGAVPLTKYGLPSSDEIPNNIAEAIQHYDAVLLENHGALTYSDSLLNAYLKMESVEFYAQLLYLTEQLGGGQKFPPEEIERLYGVRRAFGMKGRHPADEV